jgi:hypothetical protein
MYAYEIRCCNGCGRDVNGSRDLQKLSYCHRCTGIGLHSTHVSEQRGRTQTDRDSLASLREMPGEAGEWYMWNAIGEYGE